MSGGKGGSQSSSVEIPDWIRGPSERNLARAEYAAGLGYVPYYGPDVAAMTPMQQASMQNTNQAAGAFGMAAPSDPMAGMPQAQNFGGMNAYSSGNLYDQALNELALRRPAQSDALTSMFIDPVTGQRGVEFTPSGAFSTNTASAGVQNLSEGSAGATPMESAGRFAAGRYNIDGGNTAGYSPNQYVSLGMDLKSIPNVGLMGLLGDAAGDALIGYDVEDINGTPTITTRGSFDQGAFSGGDSSPTDVSGGASGGNVATNQYGDKVSVGYGYGQVDPAIAKAAGYTTGSGDDYSYQPSNPTTGLPNYTAPSLPGDSGGGSSPAPSGGGVVTDRNGNAVTDRSGNAVQAPGPAPSSGGGGGSSDSGGGGCFITTATMKALSTDDDDNAVLNKFRSFRDEHMGGKQGEASEYYEVAPKIVEAIGDNDAEYGRIWDTWLSKAHDDLNAGDMDSAYNGYKEMYYSLKNKWLGDK